MADISKITLPNGTTYEIKDAKARAAIGGVTGAMHYIGTTTTALSDGSTANPITIDGSSVTPASGDVAIYGSSEFVWSETEGKWREFGSTGSLKALAFKDSASASYTPSGSVSQPNFVGTKATISADFTPEGKVSAPDINVTMNTTGIKPFGSAGTLPTCTLPALTASVSDETLVLVWSEGSFSAGTLPSAGASVTVATGVKSATASAPTFTGTEGTASAEYTPQGTVGKPTFTGTNATITVN